MNAGSSQAREPHTSADPGKPSGSTAAIKSASPPCGACIRHRTIAMCGLLDQGCRSAGFSTRPLLEGFEAFCFGKGAFFGLRGALLLGRWLFAIGRSFYYVMRSAERRVGKECVST